MIHQTKQKIIFNPLNFIKMENLKLISEIQIKLKLNDIWYKVHSLHFDQSPENINKILKLTDDLIEQLRTNIYIKELQSENK